MKYEKVQVKKRYSVGRECMNLEVLFSELVLFSLWLQYTHIKH